MNKIPIIYQIIYEKFISLAPQGRIESDKAKRVLSMIFHIYRNYHTAVLVEMVEMGLIKLNGIGSRWIDLVRVDVIPEQENYGETKEKD